jgi:hypothetical protein
MRSRHLLLGTVGAALLAAGCSSGGSSDSVTTAAAATTTAAPATTAVATTTSAAGNEASIEDQAQAALLTPEEVGTGFVADTWKPGDPAEPTPCGTPSVDATIPAAVQVGAVMGLASTNQALQEEISVYTDEEEVDQAFGVGVTGLSCTAGTVTFADGTTAPLAITAAIDVTTEVGGDRALAWQLHGGGVQGVLVAVKLSGILVTFQFTAPDTATDLQPEPLTVAKTGMDKILKS